MTNVFKKYVLNPPVIKLGQWIEKMHFSDKPIFILGAPRSGTTLLLSILSANPRLFSIPKQTYAFDKWKTINGREIPSRLDRLYREFIISKIPADARRWIEKTPKHIQSLDKILDYFKDDVQILHIIRDGRDVVTSSHPHYIDRRFYWVDIERWLNDVNFGLQLAENHENIYTVRYEDIIENYEKEIRAICNFLNEEYVTQLDDWTGNTRIKKSIHWGTKVQKIHSNSIHRWKNSEHKERIQHFMENEEAVSLLKTLQYD
jgi:Sulfotransferase family